MGVIINFPGCAKSMQISGFIYKWIYKKLFPD